MFASCWFESASLEEVGKRSSFSGRLQAKHSGLGMSPPPSSKIFILTFYMLLSTRHCLGSISVMFTWMINWCCRDKMHWGHWRRNFSLLLPWNWSRYVIQLALVFLQSRHDTECCFTKCACNVQISCAYIDEGLHPPRSYRWSHRRAFTDKAKAM